jgi:hypothetical protein
VEYVDALGFLTEILRQCSGAIRRVVIHDQHIDSPIFFENPRDDTGNVVGLVERRNDDEET